MTLASERFRKGGEEPKGRTIQGIDYKRIEYTHAEIHHVMKIVTANSHDARDAKKLLEHLGLLPEQQGKWFEWLDSESLTSPESSTDPGSS